VARWDAAWFRRLDAEIMDLPFQELETQAAIRRGLGSDPIAFAVLYFPHHITDKATGRITWSEAHFEWARMAEEWKTPDPAPRQFRRAVIAPRECGKSTWWFLILPLWAAANGHSTFVAAFAHATAQAEKHLSTFRHELETNALLGLDYPELCRPARRRSGTTVSDRSGMIQQASGFTFAARGIDTAVLGMKVNTTRPDVLIMDDVEPDEANYSPELAEKRLGTITDSIFPLNIYARVVFVGTVTMPGSIMHQLVKAASGVETAQWITDEAVTAQHFRAIQVSDDGTEFSLWPAKWPLDYLQSIRHTRSYAKNYDNDPMARDGIYWTREDFTEHYDTFPCTRTLLVVDPAVTSKAKSDFTGLAVVGFAPGQVIAGKRDPGRVLIKYAIGVRKSPEELRQFIVTKILPEHPEIRAILVETNQGGDLWAGVFHDLPGVKVLDTKASESKEVRFGEGVEQWQRHRVFTSERFPSLEEQAVGFPRAAYDDVVDAAVTGVRYFLRPKQKVKAAIKTRGYA
jgi:hypothetical protein